MTGYFYKEHPETCDPEDFWGQVKRTVNGKPVSQDQIDMIVAAVTDELALSPDDVLLDLCCGNGALTTHFFQRCAGGVGVDFSDFLISVARKHFIRRPGEEFEVADVVKYVRTCARPERFTKAVCYGSLQYLPRIDAAQLLRVLGDRFCGLKTMFIGNVPDKQRAGEFFGANVPTAELDSPETPIGVWRTREEFTQMAMTAGWGVTFHQMPQEYYGARYRYDALLTRAPAAA